MAEQTVVDAKGVVYELLAFGLELVYLVNLLKELSRPFGFQNTTFKLPLISKHLIPPEKLFPHKNVCVTFKKSEVSTKNKFKTDGLCLSFRKAQKVLTRPR